MQQVLRDHRLADAVRTDQDDVGRLLDEVQGEELFDERPVALVGPGLFEAGHRIGTCCNRAAFRRRCKLRRERSASSIWSTLRQPGFVDDGLDVGEQPMQAEAQQARAQVLKVEGFVRRVRAPSVGSVGQLFVVAKSCARTVRCRRGSFGSVTATGGRSPRRARWASMK